MDAESTARSLLLRLGNAGEWPSPSLLEGIIACGEAAVQPIDELLSTDLLRAAQNDGAAYWLLYYALGVLGELKTPAAMPIFVRAFPLLDEDTQEWMSDWILPIGPAAIEPLIPLLTDEGMGEYHRATASNILVELAGEDPERRTRVVEVLRGIVADYAARYDTLTNIQQQALTFFASDLLDFADPEARPIIEAALADGKIEEDFFNQQDVDERYAGGRRSFHPTYHSWLDRYRSDYQKHRSAALLEALEREDRVEEPVVVGKRVGRNDPCWCGSGKKYKKCHLAADERSGRL